MSILLASYSNNMVQINVQVIRKHFVSEVVPRSAGGGTGNFLNFMNMFDKYVSKMKGVVLGKELVSGTSKYT